MDMKKNHAKLLFSAISFSSILMCSVSYGFAPAGPATPRTITFKNLCNFPVWFTFTGSATGSTCAVSGSAECVTKDGANSDCNPDTKTCFWVLKSPDNNYQLAPNGGTKVTTFTPAGGTSVRTDGIVLSGNIAGRTGCTPSSDPNNPLICETAGCTANSDGGCKTGVGSQPPASLAEFSLLGNIVGGVAVDTYDISILDGVNIPIEMAPDSNHGTLVPSDPYWCGNPGGVNPATANLGKSTWQFSPPSNDYVFVAPGGASCLTDATCAATEKCGLSVLPGNHVQKTCGKFLGFWTAKQVCGQSANTFGAPFNCAASVSDRAPAQLLSNLYDCKNQGINTCYPNTPPALSNCCGCIDWWTVSGVSVTPITDPKNVCITPASPTNPNPNWIDGVLGKITWLKTGSPTSYSYPFDDPTSTFKCNTTDKTTPDNTNSLNYTITYCPGSVQPTPPTPIPPGPNPRPMPSVGGGGGNNHNWMYAVAAAAGVAIGTGMYFIYAAEEKKNNQDDEDQQ